ncbi:pyridine nucleotide-disulfide oxidoreductase [Paenibacillus sp. FSL H8-0548]|uniref:FAD-dependent oxidoreductase n=1 Tax=Paenibacillus sp. FSL H8-0548 TaxID=1920422 RepID=UPI00096E6023|nr:FAD-dependent oxidoreductase [Paenibacillus sp. FSL H8-0548]OMF38083.1 pyridine nucleotide-disulfide oxidoreductase [Paenibacillus sp. FSL H8-0548]
MKHELVKTDITVVGGGLAGVCAAVAAARLGQTVSLINNRPVLGGNSSSEVRVWVCGATAHGTQRYARETGIMGEMFVENQYRNPDGNPYLWDIVVLETVLAEPNIRLFLNTDVHEVEAEGAEEDRVIRSVTGWMMGSERMIRFESQIFIDCTGDGLVGFLAGAKYRIGREAKAEFNEDWAPDIADDITLGSTLLFYTKEAKRPVKYIPPSFAKDITETTIPIKRVIRSGDSGCHYWWIEWGGEMDTVHDNERIRDELWSVIYGIWDYIKNSGKFEAEHMTLEWVGSIPGKREYRRFIGDYMLNQNDILEQKPFEDRVAFGGWSIDLHPPQGMYSTESGSKHLFSDGIYHIPFRSLYSNNISNLMFAGRDISATHVAFGTTRVMATCAVIGEAAGSGAALSLQRGVEPRLLHRDYMGELQQLMLRQDASIIGIAGDDPDDLAKSAHITASSTLNRIAVTDSTTVHMLNKDLGILFPVQPALETVELLLDCTAAVTLEAELWHTGKGENYVPKYKVAAASTSVAPGSSQWVKLDFPWKPDAACNAFLIIKANEAISLHGSDRALTGVLCFEKGPEPIVSSLLEESQPEQPLVQWSMRAWNRHPICFQATPNTEAYAAEHITDGYVRPFAGPHLWVSEEMTAGQEEWIDLEWENEKRIAEIHITFNDDVNEDLINLHHHRTVFEAIPEVVRSYRVEALIQEEWIVVAAERDNHKRKRVHTLEHEISSSKIRLWIENTNGGAHAEVAEIRVYAL